MNETHQSLPWWQFLLAFVVFIAVLGLAYFYREQITEIVLVPILYVLWIIDIALQMFGQRCIWLLALVIALALSLVFSRRNEKPVKDLDRTVYTRGPAVGRIHFWRRRVRVNSGAIYAISYRRSEMRQLVIRALAYRENSRIRDIEDQLRSGQLSVPAEVSHLLGLDDQPEESHKSLGLIDFIKLRFEWITERFVTPRYSPDPKIEKVAEYLENLMEVDNDTRNH
jgi:hypothetical protein